CTVPRITTCSPLVCTLMLVMDCWFEVFIFWAKSFVRLALLAITWPYSMSVILAKQSGIFLPLGTMLAEKFCKAKTTPGRDAYSPFSMARCEGVSGHRSGSAAWVRTLRTKTMMKGRMDEQTIRR